jgi:hypothetical protein
MALSFYPLLNLLAAAPRMSSDANGWSCRCYAHAMTRSELHQLVDELPEGEVDEAAEALRQLAGRGRVVRLDQRRVVARGGQPLRELHDLVDRLPPIETTRMGREARRELERRGRQR